MDQDQIERKRAYSLKYAEQHRAETNAKTAERYQHLKVTDPERLKAKRLRDYAARDPEAQAASTKRWYQKKWDEQKAKRVANSAKLAEYGKAYARANPEKGRARSQRRRARTIGAEGYHIAEDVRRIGDLQKWRCHWCGKLTKDRFHVDHIKPLSKGGSNWPNNLCIACPSCNRRKSATDPIEFARRNGKLL
jgi:5-methylcytosine-specific restriction endonuclease McrA